MTGMSLFTDFGLLDSVEMTGMSLLTDFESDGLLVVFGDLEAVFSEVLGDLDFDVFVDFSVSSVAVDLSPMATSAFWHASPSIQMYLYVHSIYC